MSRQQKKSSAKKSTRPIKENQKSRHGEESSKKRANPSRAEDALTYATLNKQRPQDRKPGFAQKQTSTHPSMRRN